MPLFFQNLTKFSLLAIIINTSAQSFFETHNAQARHIADVLSTNSSCPNAQETSLEITYVYCSDQNRNWHWLTDQCNRVQKVTGVWQSERINTVNYKYFKFSTFSLENAEQQYRELKSKCQRSFGSDFSYPQPANNRISGWSLFSVTNENKTDIKIFSGNITVADCNHRFILGQSDCKDKELLLNNVNFNTINDIKNMLK